MDSLRDEGSLAAGVRLDQGGLLTVVTTSRTLPPEVTTNRGQDSKILSVAADKEELEGKEQVIFITKDTNLRIRADAIGIETENFEPERTEVSELYSGMSIIDADSHEVDLFYANGKMIPPDPYYAPNEFVLIRDANNPSHTAMGRFCTDQECILPISNFKQGVWGIRPRNKEQQFALDLLLDERIKLVTLVGMAGTGKTLMAIAAGLQQVTDDQCYQKLLVSRPIFPMGRDLGYLPGDVEEKLNPWMQPIFDNVEFSHGPKRIRQTPRT